MAGFIEQVVAARRLDEVKPLSHVRAILLDLGREDDPRVLTALADELQKRAGHSAWHATSGEVYHDNRQCPEGKDIDPWYTNPGKGGRRRCKHCADLDQ